MTINDAYSIANANQFGWASIGGSLPRYRLAHLDHVVGPQVLDAGCGGGGYVRHLLAKGFHATGVDKFDDFVRLAHESGLREHVFVADVTTGLPFKDKQFDTTICFDVLEHVDDVLALSEIVRVTKSRLIITVPQTDEALRRFRLSFDNHSDTTHLRYYTIESFNRLLSSIASESINIAGEAEILFPEFIDTYLDFGSRYALLRWIYRHLFRVLKPRIRDPKIYTNLVAIVHLKKPDCTL
jgi:SAM-dependent methyltransferase